MSFDFPLEVAKQRKKLQDLYLTPNSPEVKGVLGQLSGMYGKAFERTHTPTVDKFRAAYERHQYEEAQRRAPQYEQPG